MVETASKPMEIRVPVSTAHLQVSRVQSGVDKEKSRGEEIVELWPERAVYWPRKQTLMVTDLHWGKSQTFRAHGIPIPGGILQEDLNRLSRLIRDSGAQRVMILGDLIHARAGLTEELFAAIANWRTLNPVEMILICGNHDRHCSRFPAEWQLEIHREVLEEGPFVFAHHPEPVADRYVWAGHVHPTISLNSRGDRLRFPCFHIGKKVGVLPAFSLFTGGYNVGKDLGERIIAIAGGDLVEI